MGIVFQALGHAGRVRVSVRVRPCMEHEEVSQTCVYAEQSRSEVVLDNPDTGGPKVDERVSTCGRAHGSACACASISAGHYGWRHACRCTPFSLCCARSCISSRMSSCVSLCMWSRARRCAQRCARRCAHVVCVVHAVTPPPPRCAARRPLCRCSFLAAASKAPCTRPHTAHHLLPPPHVRRAILTHVPYAYIVYDVYTRVCARVCRPH